LLAGAGGLIPVPSRNNQTGFFCQRIKTLHLFAGYGIKKSLLWFPAVFFVLTPSAFSPIANAAIHMVRTM
jgi:hypothetical protein